MCPTHAGQIIMKKTLLVSFLLLFIASVGASGQNSSKNRWTQRNAAGGIDTYERNKDGSLTVNSESPCIWCHGNKTCSICMGMGGTYSAAYGLWYTCRSCLGSKVCQNCKGSGVVKSYSRIQKDGSSSMVSNNGYTVSGNAGGYIVTNPNGKKSAYPSKGGSSRENSRRNDSPTYVEEIQYSPNYTGLSNNMWCEKCQSVSPAHVHIKKRVR